MLSVATLSGNPQNILVGTFSGIGYLKFAAVLTPVAVAGLIVQVMLLWWLDPEVRSRVAIANFTLPRYRLHKPLLTKTVAIATGLLIAFVLGVPLGKAALVVEAAANLGYKLSFWEHLRFGLPLSAIALLIAYFWI